MLGKYSRKRATGTLAVVMCVALVLLLAPQAGADQPNGGVSYSNPQDHNCQSWSISNPWSGYGGVATSAGVICLRELWGTIWPGKSWDLNRGTLTSNLKLWGHLFYNGSWHWNSVTTSTNLGGCFNVPLDIHWWIVHVTGGTLCAASLFTFWGHTPPGNYHGELEVNGGLLDDANSNGINLP